MVFPAPFPRETIASYGYRIARLSGLSSLTDLGHLFDLDIRALLEGDRVSVRALARYAGCDAVQLGQGRLDARNPHRLRIGFDPRAMVQSNPRSFRVCPLCLRGLAEGDVAATCLGRTDWLVAANHVCAEHQVRLVQVTPPKPARVHRDLAPLIPLLEHAQRSPPRPEPATALERHIAGCLDGTLVPSWAGNRDLLNAQDAARALGVSIDVLKGLIADGLLLPDYQFNDRMRGFSRETLDRFLAEWCTGPKSKRGRAAKIALLELARSRCVRTSRLLLAARALGVPLLRDARRHGLAGVFVSEADTVALLRQVREQVEA